MASVQSLVITFSDEDLRYTPLQQDDPMVISVITAEYKVERVLINQGSSTNILYWSTFQKLGLSTSILKECLGTLFTFAGERGLAHQAYRSYTQWLTHRPPIT
ncbi:hypothetical protein CR513_09025, partial [Mucuna pruriens]